jgi:hypothetical protein
LRPVKVRGDRSCARAPATIFTLVIDISRATAK